MLAVPTPPYPELPSVVRQRREAGRKAMRSAPQHDLLPGYRNTIVDAFEPWPVRVLTMVCLALMTCREVLSVWDSVFPDDRSPHEWLATVEQALLGQISQEEAERVTHSAHFHVLSLPFDQPLARAVAHAASFTAVGGILLRLDDLFLNAEVIAARTAAVPLTRPPQEPGLGRPDADYERDEHDASFWASVAVAGGEPWEAAADSEKRLQFWEWWLDEAIPQAYAVVYPHISEPLRQ
jgi:hypothetical protein